MKKLPPAVETAIAAYKQVKSVLPFGANNIETNPYFGTDTLTMRINLSRMIAELLFLECSSITESFRGRFHQYILFSAIMAEVYQAGNCEEQSAVAAFWLLSEGNMDTITLVRQKLDDHVYLAYTQDDLRIQLDPWKTCIEYTNSAKKIQAFI